MTAQQYIELALKTIGALAKGETAATEDLSDGLITLNMLLSAWSNERLIVPYLVSETFTLPAKQTVTIGTGMDLVTSNPSALTGEIIVTDGGVKYTVLPALESYIRGFNPIESRVPEYYCFIAGIATSSIIFDSIPIAGSTATIMMYKPFTELSTLSTATTFPKGYDTAITYSLAALLSPSYGKPLTNDIASIATEATEKLKRWNASLRKNPPVRLDVGVPGIALPYNSTIDFI